MAWMSRLLRRLRLLVFLGRTERSMDAEIRRHLDEEIADRIARGMTPDAARRSALVDFGGIEQVKEAARDARGGRGAADVWADLRDAVRMRRRRPVFTGVALLTFTLGAGAGTAVLSVAYGVLWRPLPYADPQRLVVLWERDVRRNRDQNVASADTFEAWRRRTRSFTGIAALMPTSATIAAGGDPERVAGAEVTPGYFDLLGVHPAIGRDFTAEDARTDSAVILSDGLWRRRYGGDRNVVGRTMLIGEHRRTIAGVMPAAFDPPQFGWLGEQQLWFPMALTEANRAWGRYLLVVARLEPGATIGTARADLVTLATTRAAESAGNAGWSATVVSLAAQISGGVQAPLLALLLGVALLLAMAITNVSLLTLSAMQGRARELAVRRAMGATDARLFRQLFVQSAVVGLIGTAAGLLVAVPGTRLLVRFLPPDLPRAGTIAVDLPVVLIVTGLMAVATALCGTVAARRGIAVAGRSLAGRDAGDARATARTGGAALVSAEIALGLAVSVMAVLMVRSFVLLRHVDLGFDADRVVAARVAAPSDKYSSPSSQRAFLSQVIERIAALPGVESAAVISGRPFGGIGPATRVRDAGVPRDPAAAPIVADVRYADAGAFRTLRIPIVRGTVFAGDADGGGPPQVVISESLARAVWPDGPAVGRRLAIDMYNGMTPEVIGVVADVHLVDARTPARPLAFLSASQFPDSERDVLVRTTGAPDAIVPSIRAAIGAVEPGVPLYRVAAMPQLVDRALASDRITTVLLSVFAVAALMLAGIGIFGVFSTDIGRRRKEIGLRLALGGSATGVMTLLLGQAMRRAVMGTVAGLALAGALARSMRTLLFGIGTYDPLSMLLVTAGILMLTMTATLIPAAQALRASPLAALRDE